MSKIKTLKDVVDWRMCLGCGACAYLAGHDRIRMVDVPEEGLRPKILEETPELLTVCPGLGNDLAALRKRPGIMPEAFAAFGPVLEIWEGHAGDEEIRYKGSSGGALTALSLHCLEHENMSGVLHIGQDPENSARNTTRLSRNRDELMECVGSRYAPASVCERLDLVDEAPGSCVVIGQPSEITALSKVLVRKPALGEKIGLTLSFFCAGSPATKGTLELMRRYKVEPSKMDYLRYRGYGWPGFFSTRTKDQSETSEHLSYEEAWAFLQRFRPFSTHLFPDGSGEEADISCGDPWYRPIQPGEPGSSLIVVRTERGRAILKRAIECGAIIAKPATYEQLEKSQQNLTRKRGAIWGRLLAFRLLKVPAPCYTGYSLYANWRLIPAKEKTASVFGTMRRIIQRGYNRKAR
jgi:coenzyme F420 hydrogenase subunit beta